MTTTYRSTGACPCCAAPILDPTTTECPACHTGLPRGSFDTHRKGSRIAARKATRIRTLTTKSNGREMATRLDLTDAWR